MVQLCLCTANFIINFKAFQFCVGKQLINVSATSGVQPQAEKKTRYPQMNPFITPTCKWSGSGNWKCAKKFMPQLFTWSFFVYNYLLSLFRTWPDKANDYFPRRFQELGARFCQYVFFLLASRINCFAPHGFIIENTNYSLVSAGSIFMPRNWKYYHITPKQNCILALCTIKIVRSLAITVDAYPHTRFQSSSLLHAIL